MSFGLSAGVYTYEIDKSAFVTSGSSSICAVVAGLTRGPMGPTLVTSTEEFEQFYGTDTPASWSKAPYAIKAALLQTPALYVNRIVNGALYGGVSVLKNNTTLGSPFPVGTEGNYSESQKNISLITFSDRLQEGNTIAISVDDGEGSSSEITQEFTTSSNETLASLATKLQIQLDSMAEGGNVEVVKAWTSSNRYQQSSIKFNSELTEENAASITITLKDIDNTDEVITQAFETDNNATLQAIVNQINDTGNYTAILKTGVEYSDTILINAVNAGPDQFSIKVEISGDDSLTYETALLKEGHGVYDDRSIQVVMPINTQISLKNPDVSGGSNLVTVDINANVRIFDVFAENPGAWSSNYGIKIANVDYGTASRFTIQFTDKLIKDNIFTGTLIWKEKNYDISVSFADTSDATLQAIADEIKSKLSGLGRFADAYVEKVSGGSDNDRKIIVVSPDAESDLEFENLIVTGGESQAEGIVTKTLDSIPSDRTFDLQVYSKENLNSPLESFKVSLIKQLDGNGNQMYIEEVVNNSASKSKYIRVKYNVLNEYFLDEMSNIVWLNGGSDGALPTNAQIMSGWDDFADPEQITVRLLINAGYTNVAVQQKMVSIASNRKDCFAILDMPSDKQNATDAANYRNYELNINSSYGAIYTPDLLITDEDSGEQLYVNPSGYVAGQYCYTDKSFASWWAPAGLTRGVIPNVQGIRVKYSEGHRDLLAQSQVNYIREMPGKGYPIWEEYTLQAKASALQNVHVRRLCITIEVAITDFLQYNVFDPNDAEMRSGLVLAIEDYLIQVQTGRGLQVINGKNGFLVQCDENNNPAYLLDQGICVVDVYIKPISVAKFIKLNVILTKLSAEFSEVSAA